MHALSKRVEKLAGRQKEAIFVLLPKEICSDPSKPLLNTATGKLYPIEYLSQVGGKLIDCFSKTGTY